MSLAGLIEVAQSDPERPAVICQDETCTYTQLLAGGSRWRHDLDGFGVKPGDCVALTGMPSAKMVALLLALIDNANIAIPLLSTPESQLDDALRVGCADAAIHVSGDGAVRYTRCGYGRPEALLQRLRTGTPEPGLILFSSGSSGEPKASVHRFAGLLDNVTRKPGMPMRVMMFLMFDHIGGMNCLLQALWRGGTAVFPVSRSVDAVCAAIERYRVELLPTTPTFLNMMLMAGRFDRYDLSSLRLVSYGSEPMAAATLTALNAALPMLRYKQSYGMTEVGVLPTRSEGPGSVWMQMGGAGYETRIVDGILWIRASSAMLGYLNAPSPFDKDGWLNTGDRVELRDGYMRVLGRDSEIINVAGEKVYPSEIENVILQADNIADAMVCGKPNPVTGHLVVATVRTVMPEDPAALDKRVRLYCGRHLPPYKVPVIVKSTADCLHGLRFKKLRTAPVVVEPRAVPILDGADVA